MLETQAQVGLADLEQQSSQHIFIDRYCKLNKVKTLWQH
jgi:hypothetical protein